MIFKVIEEVKVEDKVAMKKALVLQPTQEEFSSGPLVYIERNRRAIESAGGLCVIQPPLTWQPPCILDTVSLTLHAPLQRIGGRRESKGSQKKVEIKQDCNEKENGKLLRVDRTVSLSEDEGKDITMKKEEKEGESLPLAKNRITQGMRSRGRGRKVAFEKSQHLETSPSKKLSRQRGRGSSRRHADIANDDTMGGLSAEKQGQKNIECERENKELSHVEENYDVRPRDGTNKGFCSDEFRLKAFEEMAAEFKTAHFWRPTNRVTDEEVEEEFWKLVANGSSVELRSALPIPVSAFPCPRRAALLPLIHEDADYIQSPWNLRNLADSNLLSHVRGVSSLTPHCHVGMCFSHAAWTMDDLRAYSVSYAHWGESTVWYCVAPSKSDADSIEVIAPELLDKMPSPCSLVESGVAVMTCVQSAGEFVVTLPGTTVARVTLGFNLVESLHYAPPAWLSHGFTATATARLTRHPMPFSYEEVIIRALHVAVGDTRGDIATATLVYEAASAVVAKEMVAIENVVTLGVTSVVCEPLELLDVEERRCLICRTVCFLSALTCPSCSTGTKLVCVQHARDLCQCPPGSFMLLQRYSAEELTGAVEQLGARVGRYAEWCSKIDAAFGTSAVKDKTVRANSSVDELEAEWSVSGGSFAGKNGYLDDFDCNAKDANVGVAVAAGACEVVCDPREVSTRVSGISDEMLDPTGKQHAIDGGMAVSSSIDDATEDFCFPKNLDKGLKHFAIQEFVDAAATADVEYETRAAAITEELKAYDSDTLISAYDRRNLEISEPLVSNDCTLNLAGDLSVKIEAQLKMLKSNDDGIMLQENAARYEVDDGTNCGLTKLSNKSECLNQNSVENCSEKLTVEKEGRKADSLADSNTDGMVGEKVETVERESNGFSSSEMEAVFLKEQQSDRELIAVKNHSVELSVADTGDQVSDLKQDSGTDVSDRIEVKLEMSGDEMNVTTDPDDQSQNISYSSITEDKFDPLIYEPGRPGLVDLKSLLQEADQSYACTERSARLSEAVEVATLFSDAAREILLNWTGESPPTQGAGSDDETTPAESPSVETRLSLDELALFSERIAALPCRIPEASGIFRMLGIAMETRDAARCLLYLGPGAEATTLVQTLKRARASAVRLPGEVLALCDRLRLRRWLDDVGGVAGGNSRASTVEVVRGLIERGAALAPHPAAERALARLHATLATCAQLEERSRGVTTLAEAESVLADARQVALSLPGVRALAGVAAGAREWQEGVERALGGEGEGERGRRVYLGALEKLGARGQGIALRLERLEEVEAQVLAGKAWLERATKTFLSKHSVYSLYEILSPRHEVHSAQTPIKRRKLRPGDAHSVHCKEVVRGGGISAPESLPDPPAVATAFKVAEQKEVEGMAALQKINVAKLSVDSLSTDTGPRFSMDLSVGLSRHNDLNSASDSPCFCVCGSVQNSYPGSPEPPGGAPGPPQHGEMIQCQLCLDLFHPACVNLPKSMLPPRWSINGKRSGGFGGVGGMAVPPAGQKEWRFLCHLCQRSRRPRLEAVLGLVMGLGRLPARVAEGEALESLAERALAWQERVREFESSSEIIAALARLTAESRMRADIAARDKTDRILHTELRRAAMTNSGNVFRLPHSGLEPSYSQFFPPQRGPPAYHGASYEAYPLDQGFSRSGSPFVAHADVRLQAAGFSRSSHPIPAHSDSRQSGFSRSDSPFPPQMELHQDGFSRSGSPFGTFSDASFTLRSGPMTSSHGSSRHPPLAHRGAGHSQRVGFLRPGSLSFAPRAGFLPPAAAMSQREFPPPASSYNAAPIEHAYSTVSKYGGGGGGCQQPLRAPSRPQEPPAMPPVPLLELTDVARAMIDQLLMEGDLIEVTLDESKRLCAMLRAAQPPGCPDAVFQLTGVPQAPPHCSGESPPPGGGDPRDGASAPKQQRKRRKQEMEQREDLGAGWGDNNILGLGGCAVASATPAKKQRAQKGALAKATAMGFSSGKNKFGISSGVGTAGSGGRGGIRKRRGQSNAGKGASSTDDCSAVKCRRPLGKEVHWVQCDRCELWFHYLCVGLRVGEVKEDEDYICTVCLAARGR